MCPALYKNFNKSWVGVYAPMIESKPGFFFFVIPVPQAGI